LRSNDWFIVSFRARYGALVETQGMVVTDNLGFNTLIEPTAARGPGNVQRLSARCDAARATA
jgi:hypothetical protein